MTETEQTKKPKPEGPPPISNEEQSRRILEAIGASHVPGARELETMFKLAVTLHASGLFKRAGGPAGIFAIMLMGHEYGLPYMMSLNNIDIVDGRPALSTQLMYALAKRAGVQIKILQRDENEARIELAYQGQREIFSFSQADVQRAQLSGKDNHKKYPVAMLFWRALADGLRVVAPDALLKAYTIDEITDGRAMHSEDLDLIPDFSGQTGLDGEPYQRPATQQPKPDHRGGQPPSGNLGGQEKPKIAAPGFINQIRNDLQAAPWIPDALRERGLRWIEDNEGTWSLERAGSLASSIRKMTVSPNGERNTTAPTEKQKALITELAMSGTVPDALKAKIKEWWNGRHPSATTNKINASAIIECLRWIVDHAKPNGGDDPGPDGGGQPPKPEKYADDLPFDQDDSIDQTATTTAQPTGPAKAGLSVDDLVFEVGRELDRRLIPEKKREAIQAYLDDPENKDIDILNSFLENARAHPLQCDQTAGFIKEAAAMDEKRLDTAIKAAEKQTTGRAGSADALIMRGQYLGQAKLDGVSLDKKRTYLVAMQNHAARQAPMNL